MKKLISLLAVVALIASFPFAAFAEQPVVLTMEGVTVEAGVQSVTLTLVCDFSLPVGDGQVVITFPADKLQLTKAGSSLTENAVNTRKAAEGVVKMGFISSDGLSGSNTLLTLDFVIKKPSEAAAYTVSASTVRMADLNYHNLVSADAPVSVDATVTVTPKQVQPDPEVERLKAELSALIGQQIDESRYTPESVAAYNGLKEQAAALAQSETATAAALQDMIDQLKSTLEEKPPVTLVLGDVDGDGKITSTDARLTLQVSVDKVKLEDLPVSDAADVDKDGKNTSTDARLILQVSAGKIPGFETV